MAEVGIDGGRWPHSLRWSRADASYVIMLKNFKRGVILNLVSAVNKHRCIWSGWFLLNPDSHGTQRGTEGRCISLTSSQGQRSPRVDPIFQHYQLLVQNRGRNRKVCVLTCLTESDRKSKGSWKGGTEQEGRSVFIEVKVTVCQGEAEPKKWGLGVLPQLPHRMCPCGCCRHVEVHHTPTCWFLSVGTAEAAGQRPSVLISLLQHVHLLRPLLFMLQMLNGAIFPHASFFLRVANIWFYHLFFLFPVIGTFLPVCDYVFRWMLMPFERSNWAVLFGQKCKC